MRKLNGRCGARLWLAVAAMLLVGGCSSSTSGESSGGEGGIAYAEGPVGPEDTAGSPQDGGTLTFGSYNEPLSMDPAITIFAGSSGANEVAAIYDTLMRYDAADEKFVPQLAKSLERNRRGTVWTLTLRPGVKFSNGAALDAAAVKSSQERYAGYAAPEAGTWKANVKSIRVVDENTLVYTMRAPFAWFGSLLSTGQGMIVPPTAAPAGSKDYKPVGAGPFVFSHWKPGEEVSLRANPKYWAGRPHLDNLRFVYLGDQTTSRDALANGDLDASTFRFPDIVDEVLATGVRGYVNLVGVGATVLINAEQGRPGADLRVRQAMRLAIDPDLIRQRAYDGHGLAGPRIFEKYSRWYTPDIQVEGANPAKAKELLDQAKADGYDGKITFLGYNSPQIRDVGQALKASLEAIGFDVRLNLLPNSTVVSPLVVAKHDYDVVTWGLNFREGDPYTKLFDSLSSKGTRTYGMPTSPAMDAALGKLKGALNDGSAREALGEVQRAYNASVPFLTWMPFAELTAWNNDVHGITSGANSAVLFDHAWKDR